MSRCKVVWTQNAREGLERLFLFLADKDGAAAVKAMEVIDDATMLIEEYPEAGRPAADLEPEHRELLIPFGVSGYHLLYMTADGIVYILAVKHQREAGY